MTSSSVEQHRRAGERAAGLGPASVAICAYTMRRWDDLTEAVGSVLAQLRTGDECLLVIDYNDELLARASAEFARYDAVRVVANAQTKGLSGARNTASCASGPKTATIRLPTTSMAATLPSSRCARASRPIVERTNSTV